jgi:hypothetical protein
MRGALPPTKSCLQVALLKYRDDFPFNCYVGYNGRNVKVPPSVSREAKNAKNLLLAT